MTSTEKASSRERLLDAAAGLFYREGVGVGVEALCQAAGVSKRSMYQMFGSKDEVLAASLERSASGFHMLVFPEPDDDRPPRERIMHVFERLEEVVRSPEYVGCPFVATAVELKDAAHPASVVARAAKREMTAFFRGEAERCGARDPETLARQLTMVFDGASTRVVVHDEPLDGLSTITAAALLDAAGVS
ncbi:TetR/AcrR family transcriptional regulator [Sphaerisporangium corydalis]|uniref:TetR/AcrR family transcriptional regulator n=1 Tax=Sphaerisporangium corydalis TaxID=1441875 RepID=A0ABV9EEU9_9ACTN|nr:TetR/AcrR family transcriptional regulator [Sphaerisporangium corydalis]